MAGTNVRCPFKGEAQPLTGNVFLLTYPNPAMDGRSKVRSVTLPGHRDASSQGHNTSKGMSKWAQGCEEHRDHLSTAALGYVQFLDLLQEASRSGTPNCTFYAHVGQPVNEIIQTHTQNLRALPRAVSLVFSTVCVDITGKSAPL